MKKRIYKAIDIYFESELALEYDSWKRFQADGISPIFSVEFYSGSKILDVHGLRTFSVKDIDVCHITFRENTIMLSDILWKRAVILSEYNLSYLLSLLCQLFYTHAVQRHIIYLHSSLIDFQGRGLMFLGPSGIGKTTQAELWNKYRDALIINGDVVFVQEAEDTFLGWGTPWHGSSPYCENASVPVHAMIVLKQSSENSIRELTGFEKVTAVSTSVFYPRWLENGMELCLETLDHFLSRVPVYELSCRPDEDAVKLTEEAVFGSRL